jgi:hypothetical protein
MWRDRQRTAMRGRREEREPLETGELHFQSVLSIRRVGTGFCLAEFVEYALCIWSAIDT